MTVRLGNLLGGLDKQALEQRFRRAGQAEQTREGRRIAIRDLATGTRYETTETMVEPRERSKADRPGCCWGEGVLPVLLAVDGGRSEVCWLRCTCEAASRWVKRDSAGIPIPGRFWTASYLDVLGCLPPTRQDLENGLQTWLRGEALPEPKPPPVSPASYYERPDPQPDPAPEPPSLFDAPTIAPWTPDDVQVFDGRPVMSPR